MYNTRNLYSSIKFLANNSKFLANFSFSVVIGLLGIYLFISYIVYQTFHYYFATNHAFSGTENKCTIYTKRSMKDAMVSALAYKAECFRFSPSKDGSFITMFSQTLVLPFRMATWPHQVEKRQFISPVSLFLYFLVKIMESDIYSL